MTVGSFAYFRDQTPPSRTTTAKHPWSDALPAPHNAPVALPAPTAFGQQEVAGADLNTTARHPVSPVPSAPPPKEVPPQEVVVAPAPRPVRSDLSASPILPPLQPFEFIDVHVPFLRTVTELEREDIRQELIDDLGTTDPRRFDLFVRDTARGAEVFQNAAKAAGLTVFADAATLDKLKKGQAAAVVIYTENLTAAELAALFAKVSVEDAKFSPRVCDSLLLRPNRTLRRIRTEANPRYRRRTVQTRHRLKRRWGERGERHGAGGRKAQQDPRAEAARSADTVDSVVQVCDEQPAKTPAVLMDVADVASERSPHGSRYVG